MVRVATFNVENLFARYDFASGTPPAPGKPFTVSDLKIASPVPDGKLELTVQAIREINADVLCLQEVDSLPALDWLHSRHLGGMEYHHRMLVDGNDQRGIDVALMSRHPIVSVRSYRHELAENGAEKLFSRDCLEAVVMVESVPLTLYLNHFKSMAGGRAQTQAKRSEQASRVAAIVEAAWKPKGYVGNFLVAGDFNDYVGEPGDPKSAIEGLVCHEGLKNAMQWILDPEQRYTHSFLPFGEKTTQYHQLDYLLLSKALAEKNEAQGHNRIGIMRKGMPYRAEKYDGPRFQGVGLDEPKASDHAAVWVDLDLV